MGFELIFNYFLETKMKFIKFYSGYVIFSTKLFLLFLFVDQSWAATSPAINDVAELENQVHVFYHDAWTELMIFITIVLTVLGVAMPLLITYLQNNNFKLQNQEMKESIASAKKEIFEDARKLISEEIVSEMKLAFASAEKLSEVQLSDFVSKKLKEISSNIENSEGRIFHIQANLSATQQKYSAALSSLLIACRSYCLASDLTNLKTCLDSTENLLKKVTKTTIEKQTQKRVTDLIDAINRPETEREIKDLLPKVLEIDKEVKRLS